MLLIVNDRHRHGQNPETVIGQINKPDLDITDFARGTSRLTRRQGRPINEHKSRHFRRDDGTGLFMKISMKTDYALRAQFTLVEFRGQGPIPIRELARRNEVPKRFLEHIMLELKARGWVESVPGKLGGYVLSCDPERVAMGQVVRHFEGVLSPIGCVSVSRYERCSQEPVCRFRRVFLTIRNETAKMMDRTTLADVYAGQPVRREEVFDQTLMAGAGI
jgi:Rrf2 family protein